MTRDRAKEIITRFSGGRILVIGDLMLDRYVHGSVSRISPEAPVPIVHVRGEHARPGGAANVALNVQALGGRAVVAGYVGTDPAGEELVGLLAEQGIDTHGVVRSGDVQTTVKTRVLADRQQVVRVDREERPSMGPGPANRFCRRIAALCKSVDGVIIEDYGKGVVTQAVIDAACDAASRAGIPAGLDPKDNHKLDVRGITVATPNFGEACAAAALPATSLTIPPVDDPTLREAGKRLMRKWQPRFLIITLGPHGMMLLRKRARPVMIPARAREVFDVSGAGDTVIAVTLLSLVCGADDEAAASLANEAAGVVVGKLGTAVCTRDDLLASVGA